MRLLTFILAALLDIVPYGDAALTQLQSRDSILIADQLRYEVLVKDMEAGQSLALPDLSALSGDTLAVIGSWRLDTLSAGREIHSRNSKAAAKILRKKFDVRASIILAPFEEGHYELPDIPVLLGSGTGADTLVFKGLEMDVKTMPVDTSTFVPHDIKGQINYPLTAGEVLPWVGAGLLLAALAVIALLLARRAAARRKEAGRPKDPAYIVALRELEKYRSEKYWAPERQKAFYSGITDALKVYIDERFGVDAPEMTTAELFDALKTDKDISPELYSSLKELFERADFVKFAKYAAADEENASALPLAVRFVTSTYQNADAAPETGGEAGEK
ncbi:MAG: hypothetical protein J1D85_01890 [Bacteroidales bacterium]|nr:hypothetical protein [Bacteroidales bacterium]